MESTSLNFTPYPPPETTYEKIVANRFIFLASLEKLHSAMGTKFKIPIIGGKEIDLHQLFVEVTSRGGIEKVVSDRKWKDVTSVFNFPLTSTNASFMLRKYYISLLHHFEQIYFSKAVGWTPVDSGSCSHARATTIPTRGVTSMLPPASQQAQTSSATQLPAGVASSSTLPQQVAGVIDAKFECGYLVTVTIGTEQLKGVLYEAPSEQPAQQPVLQLDGVPAKDGGTSTPRGRRRKKSEIKRRDPALPKPNRSAYNFFFAEQYVRLKPMYKGKGREISKMIGELWIKLVESERTVYQEQAMKDKERYKIEIGDYREKQRTGLVIRDAVPLRQIHAEPDLNTVYADKNEETEGGTSQTPDHYTSYVEGDSGEYKTEEEEEEEWMEEEEEEGASPQGVANMDLNILVEEHCETRAATEEDARKESSLVGDNMDLNILVEKKHCETRAATEEDARKESSLVGDDMDLNILVEKKHCETRAATEENARKESSTVGDDMDLNTLVEEEHCETRAATEEDARKESSTVGDDRDLNILVEEEHCETRAATEEDARKESSTVGDDMDLNILVEEEQCETRAEAEEHVRKESSMVGVDNEVFTSDSVMMEAKEEEEEASPQRVANVDVNILVEEEHCEMRATAEEDVRKESSTVSDDADINILVEEKHCETRAAAEEDVKKESSTVSEDKDINILVEEEDCQTRAAAEEDVTKECSTVGDDKNVNILVEEAHSDTRVETVENVRKESSTVSDDKEVFAGDSVTVETKEEQEPTTVIRED